MIAALRASSIASIEQPRRAAVVCTSGIGGWGTATLYEVSGIR